MIAVGCGGEPADPDASAADASSTPDAGMHDAHVADAHVHDTDAGDLRCPAPEEPPAGSVELASIPSNFDTAALLSTGGAIPVSAEPDVVGAFRFICNASHLAYDDPIVYPCQPGRSHLHQFFGNTLADAYSNYESLRTTGESTCENALNRSAYWIPAMMNGRGQVVVPDYVSVYYKRLPETSPECERQGIACVPIPRGLRFVFGYNAADPESTDGRGYFNCDGPTAEMGHYADIVEAASHCPPGNRLGAVISAPPCWNGVDLDSADHRSHLAYPSYGSWGYLRCPDTHPYVIPTFTLGIWYTTDDDLDRSGTWTAETTTWHLSSDVGHDGTLQRPGSTLHADWWGAWDDEVMARWHDHCVDELLNCSAGELGDGSQMIRYSGFSWNAEPRLVDPPPDPHP